MNNFIKEKLDLNIKIESCKLNNEVIVVKLGSENEKKEVMSRKNRLKGEKIFIENDLT